MLKQTQALFLCVCFGAFSCTDKSGGYFDAGSSPPNSPPDTGSTGGGAGGTNGSSSNSLGPGSGVTPSTPSPAPEPVPEPMTMLLFGSGLAGVAYRYRRRRPVNEPDTAET